MSRICPSSSVQTCWSGFGRARVVAGMRASKRLHKVLSQSATRVVLKRLGDVSKKGKDAEMKEVQVCEDLMRFPKTVEMEVLAAHGGSICIDALLRASQVGGCKSLTSLDLSHINLALKGTQKLAAAHSTCNQVKQMILQWNDICSAAAGHLAN